VRFIYLHGFASGPSSGKAQYFRQRFLQRGKVLEIPDLVEGDFSSLTVTGQLEVIERIGGNNPVTLIGSSMGGYLAALYASIHPETHKLVLLAPAFQFPARWPDELGPEKAAEWRQTGSLEVFHYREGRPRQIGWQLIEDAQRYDPEPSFLQPALIFHGTNDTVVSPAYSKAFASRHPNVRLFLLDSDHQLTDSTDLIWKEMAAFLATELL
jgi:pimeloyl-ACP methyl ester carboxylesterase